MTGKVCLVTGANSGIGKETARELARMGATVILGCRHDGKAVAARDEIVRDTGNENVRYSNLDVSSRASICETTAFLKDRYSAIHVLVNNAAIWLNNREESVDGIEMSWATNQLGYFMLTYELLDLLKESAPARIVNVASALAHGLDLGDVEFKKRQWDGEAAYAQTKQANRMFSNSLSKKLEGTGVTSNSLHPGVVASEIWRHQPSNSYWSRSTSSMISPAKGAETPIWLASEPELETVSGKYCYRKNIGEDKFDESEMGKLWALCEEMMGSCSLYGMD